MTVAPKAAMQICGSDQSFNKKHVGETHALLSAAGRERKKRWRLNAGNALVCEGVRSVERNHTADRTAPFYMGIWFLNNMSLLP